ncbi:MAG: PQQ-dependent sugar dehydrogenase, partial [Rhizobiales bacterium]|nr:PQQ-dependent sugar dehydrogenase [Hyphomicrobiales bacterium]
VLRVVGADGSVSAPIAGVPEVVSKGQGGLLDVVPHPDFAVNKLIYLTYSGQGDGGASTELARGRLEGDQLLQLEVLFRAVPKIPSAKHFGSRIAFAPDGSVHVSLGDRGHRDEAQNVTNHLGASIRLDQDGSIPADNPFVGGDHLPETFSFGHRNIQGMAVNPASGEVWAHEHGPKGGDEVNILKSSANFGWPVITYGTEYSGAPITHETTRPDMEQPVLYWVPSIAPSGMAFYDGDAFADWKGDLFVGALAGRHLRRIELDGNEAVGQEMLLTDLGRRIRDVRAGPDGYVYVLSDGENAVLLRLEPVAQ